MDGPGRCAGRVEIQYEGKWQRVTKQGWTDTNSDNVCKQLKCGNKRKSVDKFSQGSGVFLAKAVNCKPNAEHISECISDNSDNPTGEKRAQAVTCEGECVFQSYSLKLQISIFMILRQKELSILANPIQVCVRA